MSAELLLARGERFESERGRRGQLWQLDMTVRTPAGATESRSKTVRCQSSLTPGGVDHRGSELRGETSPLPDYSSLVRFAGASADGSAPTLTDGNRVIMMNPLRTGFGSLRRDRSRKNKCWPASAQVVRALSRARLAADHACGSGGRAGRLARTGEMTGDLVRRPMTGEPERRQSS